jgi:hypothetical protein
LWRFFRLQLCGAVKCLAQSSTPNSLTDFSKETENPVTRQITLPLQYQADFFYGPYQASKDTFEIDQAVVPFKFSDDWALITRTKLPLEVQPPKNLSSPWSEGLSNGYTTFFLSPEQGSGFYWGAGPVLYYPTATNSALGVNKWGSGPSAAFLHEDAGPWVIGAVVNNIWSFGGPAATGDRTNQLLLNPVVSYHLADGWSVSTSPNIVANWIANGGKWTVPSAAASVRSSGSAGYRSSCSWMPITTRYGPTPAMIRGYCRLR